MGLISMGGVFDMAVAPIDVQAHSQNDISDIYRFPLVTKGIFVNPALQEPFGLTVIEVHFRSRLPVLQDQPSPQVAPAT